MNSASLALMPHLQLASMAPWGLLYNQLTEEKKIKGLKTGQHNMLV